MQTYIINLPEDVDKRKHMVNELQGVGWWDEKTHVSFHNGIRIDSYKTLQKTLRSHKITSLLSLLNKKKIGTTWPQQLLAISGAPWRISLYGNNCTNPIPIQLGRRRRVIIIIIIIIIITTTSLTTRFS